MMLWLYRNMISGAGPLVNVYLKHRERQGKEDPERGGERRGIASLPRPDGPLVWCHAASVGESLSLLEPVNRILDRYPDAHVLVTTVTVTSAGMMEKRLPDRAFHQYVPVDRPAWVKNFLDHWKPDLALWAESEFWPNLVLETKKRGIPAALINARMSGKSAARWKRVPKLIQNMLETFDLCLAQNGTVAEHFKSLGAPEVKISGNVKYAAQPLPVDQENLGEFTSAVSGRPVWLAASTHPGEEEQIIEAHAELKKDLPNILTVIVPRHPNRGGEIEALVKEAGLELSRRSTGAMPATGDDIYIADTMGELGVFYSAIPVSFIGGSLVDNIGGHNPIEPAQLGSAVVYGPHMFAQTMLCHDFEEQQAAIVVNNVAELVGSVKSLLDNHQAYVTAASGLVTDKAGIVDEMMQDLVPLLEKAGMKPAQTQSAKRAS